MPGPEDVRRLYSGYREQFRRMELARKPGEGIFGLGTGPRDYPCHQTFAQELEALLQAAAAERPPEEAVEQMLEYIYFGALEEQNGQDAVYWMLLAVHSLTYDLAALLSPARAKSMCDRYQAAYPRRNRLPAQKKLLRVLQARGGGDLQLKKRGLRK